METQAEVIFRLNDEFFKFVLIIIIIFKLKAAVDMVHLAVDQAIQAA